MTGTRQGVCIQVCLHARTYRQIRLNLIAALDVDLGYVVNSGPYLRDSSGAKGIHPSCDSVAKGSMGRCNCLCGAFHLLGGYADAKKEME